MGKIFWLTCDIYSIELFAKNILRNNKNVKMDVYRETQGLE